MTTAALIVEDLWVKLGNRPILKGASFTLEAGEVALLVGPSGSGKSTLLRTVAGLVAPDRGRVLLSGKVATDGRRLCVAPEDRGIGYLFQGGALWPHLSARGNLEFVLQAARVPRRERRARALEMLAWVELDGMSERRPATLSGGEAQRLALARALVARPKLLLLDEPLGPLDRALRGALLTKFTDLCERLGFAALHVTHDPEEASPHADRMFALEDGRVVESSLKEPLARRP